MKICADCIGDIASLTFVNFICLIGKCYVLQLIPDLVFIIHKSVTLSDLSIKPFCIINYRRITNIFWRWIFTQLYVKLKKTTIKCVVYWIRIILDKRKFHWNCRFHVEPPGGLQAFVLLTHWRYKHIMNYLNCWVLVV